MDEDEDSENRKEEEDEEEEEESEDEEEEDGRSSSGSDSSDSSLMRRWSAARRKRAAELMRSPMLRSPQQRRGGTPTAMANGSPPPLSTGSTARNISTNTVRYFSDSSDDDDDDVVNDTRDIAGGESIDAVRGGPPPNSSSWSSFMVDSGDVSARTLPGSSSENRSNEMTASISRTSTPQSRVNRVLAMSGTNGRSTHETESMSMDRGRAPAPAYDSADEKGELPKKHPPSFFARSMRWLIVPSSPSSLYPSSPAATTAAALAALVLAIDSLVPCVRNRHHRRDARSLARVLLHLYIAGFMCRTGSFVRSGALLCTSLVCIAALRPTDTKSLMLRASSVLMHRISGNRHSMS